MSTKEQAFHIFNQLSEKQLEAFVTLFGSCFNIFSEDEPDDIDIAMINDSRDDNDESVSLDEFAEKLGFNPHDLQI